MENNMSENLNDVLELTDKTQPETQPQEETNDGIKRYPALENISIFYKILAWLVAIGSLMGTIYGISVLAKYPVLGDSGGTIILTSLTYGLFGVIGCLALSQGIQLFMDMAENNQRQVQLLSRLVDKK